MSRFSTQEVYLDNSHPLWPNTSVVKIYDAVRQRYEYGCYLIKSAAQTVCDSLNETCLQVLPKSKKESH